MRLSIGFAVRIGALRVIHMFCELLQFYGRGSQSGRTVTPNFRNDLRVDKAHDALQFLLEPCTGFGHALFPGTFCSTLLFH